MEHTKEIAAAAVRELRRHWLAILLIALAVGVGAYFVTELCYEPRYCSEVTFAVTSPDGRNLSYTSRMAEVFAELLNSDLMDKMTGEAAVSAEAVPETNLVNLTVTAPDPQTAFLAARTVIDRHSEVTSRVVEGASLAVLRDAKPESVPVNRLDAVKVSMKAFLLAGLTACAGVVWLSAPGEEEDKLDLMDILREAGRLWRVGLLLILVCGSLMGVHAGIRYRPEYEASATFVVKAAEPQMGETMSNILTSGLLESRVMEKLGIAKMPGVSVSLLPKSGVITLSVRDQDSQRSYDALNAILEAFPDVAEAVVGDTVLVLLENSGLPAEPANARNIPAASVRGAALGLILWAALAVLMALPKTTIQNGDCEKRRS